jgi:peptidoglycan-associated lipoprotein
MTIRMMPALCAVLLLAACQSSGSDSAQPDPANDVAALPEASAPNGTPNNGANGGIVAGSLPDFNERIGNTVRFDTDSYSLNAEAQSGLQKQAAWLLQYREHAVTIEGHADERGTREYNLALGDRRAQAVVNYLIALGVDAGRLGEVSYGKEKPICPDASESCWSENRRGVTALDN